MGGRLAGWEVLGGRANARWEMREMEGETEGGGRQVER
jgi:hypothetical protein